MTHPIIKDLQKRYTTKSYDKNKKISDNNIAIISESLRLTASSINSQPWKFIIIESDKAKERFNKTFDRMFQFNQGHSLTASHIILFAHNPKYARDDYTKVIEKQIKDGRVDIDKVDEAWGAFAFAELNTKEDGNTSEWTKSQVYIALGSLLHTLARLEINSTTMEGVDGDLIGDIFADELDGFKCQLALAIGYSDDKNDYNARLPKSRLSLEDVIVKI